LLVKVKAEAEEGERGLIGPGDGFDEEASEFAILEKEIVGPFEGGFDFGEGADGVGGGEGAEEREKGEAIGGYFEKNGDPEAEGFIGKPGFALASVACGLDFGGEDGGKGGERGRWSRAEEVLGGGSRGKDGDTVTERVIGGEEEIDLIDLEGVGVA
jgi:hypothetical protein